MGEHSIVYRGTNTLELDMLEGMLAAEGLAVVRLGRASPALLGAGDSAFIQMLQVPTEQAPRALALLGASQALQLREVPVAPVPDGEGAPRLSGHRGWLGFVGSAALLAPALLWLGYRLGAPLPLVGLCVGGLLFGLAVARHRAG